MEIEKRSVMMVSVSSAMNLKENRLSVHVDLINAKIEKSSSHQENAKYVKTIPFFLRMVRAVSLQNIQYGNSFNKMVRAQNVPTFK